MDTTVLIIVLSVIIIGVAGAALIFLKKRKTKGLRTRFGPEYARAVQESGRRRGKPGSRSEKNALRVSQSVRSRQATGSAISRRGARFRHSLLMTPKVP